MKVTEKAKDQYQKSILSLASTISSYTKQWEALSQIGNYFPEDVELTEYDTIEYGMYSQTVDIRIPYNMNRADEMLAYFESVGWSERKEAVKDGAMVTFFYKYERYNDDPIKLDLTMCARNWDYPGQSCKLVQVGTKTVEQPVYEVRCKETV